MCVSVYFSTGTGRRSRLFSSTLPPPSEERSPIYCVSVCLDRSERGDREEESGWLYRCGLRTRTDDGRAFVRIGNPISGGVPSAAAAAGGGREDSAKGD